MAMMIDAERDDDDFMLEETMRAADRALELDISDNVLSWLDPMAYHFSCCRCFRCLQVLVPGGH
jgi:hypothetical protein